MRDYSKRTIYIVGEDEFEIVWHGAADSGVYSIEKNGESIWYGGSNWLYTRLNLRRLMRRQAELNRLKEKKKDE